MNELVRMAVGLASAAVGASSGEGRTAWQKPSNTPHAPAFVGPNRPAPEATFTAMNTAHRDREGVPSCMEPKQPSKPQGGMG